MSFEDRQEIRAEIEARKTRPKPRKALILKDGKLVEQRKPVKKEAENE